MAAGGAQERAALEAREDEADGERKEGQVLAVLLLGLWTALAVGGGEVGEGPLAEKGTDGTPQGDQRVVGGW